MISIITSVHNQLSMNKLFYETLVKNTAYDFQLIVIDNNSSCYSKPEIISRGYDHKTSYGTNINLIDPSVIYYLETRGFDLAEARKYIIDGFYRQVLCCVTNTSIQEEIRDFVKL